MKRNDSDLPPPRIVSRQALYDLVWEQPRSVLSNALGVSGSTIAKICERSDIPMPDYRYWPRLRKNWKVTKKPLPPRPPGAPAEFVLWAGNHRHDLWEKADAHLIGPLPSSPQFDETINELTARLSQNVRKIKVNRPARHTHPLLNSFYQVKKGWPLRAGGSFQPLHDHRRDFDLRRLNLLDALFKYLNDFQCKASLYRDDAREFTVGVRNHDVAVRFDNLNHGEGSVQQDSELEHEPLGFKVGDCSLEDGALPLEHQIAEVVVAILVEGEAQYRASLRRTYGLRIDHRKRIVMETERVSREAERVKRVAVYRAEIGRTEELVSQADALRRAENIRHYIRHVRDARGGGRWPDGMHEWIRWANDEANRLDPLLNGEWSNGLEYWRTKAPD